jgi:hypothetical protein
MLGSEWAATPATDRSSVGPTGSASTNDCDGRLRPDGSRNVKRPNDVDNRGRQRATIHDAHHRRRPPVTYGALTRCPLNVSDMSFTSVVKPVNSAWIHSPGWT